MLRRRLIIGIALLALLGATAGCAADLGQSPESADTLERTVEETIAVTEQPAEEANTLEQPPAEAGAFTIEGWVTVDAYHYDEATGTYVQFYHDESSNIVTTLGLNWIEDQLGDSPSGDPAKWISLSSDDTTAPAVGWSQLETAAEVSTEINADGLSRAAGTYTDIATGSWEIEAIFNVTGGPHADVQLTGLQWVVTPASDGNLMAANTFDPVTLDAGDTLTVTWLLSVAGSP